MKALCLTAALSSFGIYLVIVIYIRATPPSIQKLITQPSPREYSHGPTPIPSLRPFLILNNLFGGTPFWWAEGQTPHEYNWGVAQSTFNLISVIHDFAKRIHEIAQLVYDSYIRRTRSVHGWDDFGLDE